MQISLIPSEAAPSPLAARTYDPDLDCISSILSHICEAWEGHAVLRINGFGHDQWPVDIRYDLCVLIESVPLALSRLREGQDFVLDFYGQGFECRIEGLMDGDQCRLSVAAFGDWPPDPSPIVMPARSMAAQLEVLLARFRRMARAVAPYAIEHPWFVAWAGREAQG